ncbi:MAG: hypothetical protein GX989_04820 [Firmicutes bacterium]|nr:hypothetical protein [Bacillota bacterium]
MAIPEVFKKLQPIIDEILKDSKLASTKIIVDCKELTPEEAIGSPGRDDFPLQKGKEKLMQAEIDGHLGQAYTDQPGSFNGSLKEALTLPPVNNYHRAVIIAALNAVHRRTKGATSTIHCRDQGPGECSTILLDTIAKKYGNPRIAVIGLQPAMVEQLARRFETRVFDLDPDNIGENKHGVTIESGDYDLEEIEDWCDLFLVTGSSVVNGTIDPFLNRKKPVLFYGTTIAAPAEYLGLDRYCPVST